MDKATLYFRYNLHKQENIQKMHAFLKGGDDSPHIAILVGEKGCGRGFFVEAAVFRAQGDGVDYATCHVDLDGYDSESRSLDAFIS